MPTQEQEHAPFPSSTPPVALVLAAGKGTRMRSDVPKVLHELAGAPLVRYPIRAARAAGVEQVVVIVGYGADQVRARLGEGDEAGGGDSDGGGDRIRFALQAEQRGTGHAVLCALPAIAGHDGAVFILSGDVPLLRAATLRALHEACTRASAGLALASFRPPSSAGYGRILRDQRGAVVGIREHRDASAAERSIAECNAGVYCVQAPLLRRVLPTLGSANAQGEIYLTDLVAHAATEGAVSVVEIVDPLEVSGVNTPAQLRELEAVMRARATS